MCLVWGLINPEIGFYGPPVLNCTMNGLWCWRAPICDNLLAIATMYDNDYVWF